MFKKGFEFTMGVIAAYELYEFVNCICEKSCAAVRKHMHLKNSLRGSNVTISKDAIKALEKYAPDEIKPISKTKQIGFVTNFDD